MASGYLAVDAVASCLPAGGNLPDLYASTVAGRRLTGSLRWFTAQGTDLPPAGIRVAPCADPAPPAARPVRLTGLPRESRLATGVAAGVLDPGVRGDEVGVVWVSSTAGLAEYGQTCVAAATLPPGQASPLSSPLSGYAGPASAVSIRLALTGPLLALTGDRAAGATAVVEAGRLLAEGRCRQALIGGSAGVDRWRLATVPGEAPTDGVPGWADGVPASADGVPASADGVPAEGAACLLLSRDHGSAAPDGGPPGGAPFRPPGGGPAHRVGVRVLRRACLRGPDRIGALSAFLADCVRRMGAPPVAATLSAGATWSGLAERVGPGTGGSWWWVERTGGELGAAGGVQAVVAAVAACASGVPRVLVLAVGESGVAVAVEVAALSAHHANTPNAVSAVSAHHAAAHGARHRDGADRQAATGPGQRREDPREGESDESV